MNKYMQTPMMVPRWQKIAATCLLLILCVPYLMASVTLTNLTFQVTGILPQANGGTGAATLNSALTNATLTTVSFSGDLGSNVNAGAFALTTTITNDTTTGTTANLLAKLSAGKAVKIGTGDTNGILGIVVGGAGTTASAQIAIHGQAGCTADNSITQGDYIIPGTTTAGRCKSNGTTPPVGTQPIGISLTTTSAAATATILLFGPDIPDTAAGTNFAYAETPSGTVNGSNVSFTLAHSPNPVTSLQLQLNGIGQEAGGNDYTLSGATVTYVTAPPTGSKVRAVYYTF